MSFDINKLRIGIVGLGYVGLPLAVEFGKKYPTVGFDINAARVAELEGGEDSTLECSSEELAEAKHLTYVSSVDAIADCNFYIVTVPTPIGDSNRPLLTPLRAASDTLGGVLKKDDIVVYESTVYPGATEEFCVPLLEKGSGLTMNEDFFVGYSPERINPGDKEHRLPSILKVTSGSTPEVAEFVDEVYKTIITAGTHKASSIKVAEAAKVIENTQRDVNIALVNELAMIFERVGIDTEEVLEAAGTKWNFLPFRPGLVGGHCIGIDPYYLTYKAEQLGYHPQMILAGRRINDNMSLYVASQSHQEDAVQSAAAAESRILILGLPSRKTARTFAIPRSSTSRKSWSPTVSRSICTIRGSMPMKHRHEYGIDLVTDPKKGAYDGVIIAVAHDQFRAMGAAGIRSFGKKNSVLYDIKYVLTPEEVDDRL